MDTLGITSLNIFVKDSPALEYRSFSILLRYFYSQFPQFPILTKKGRIYKWTSSNKVIFKWLFKYYTNGYLTHLVTVWIMEWNNVRLMSYFEYMMAVLWWRLRYQDIYGDFYNFIIFCCGKPLAEPIVQIPPYFSYLFSVLIVWDPSVHVLF